MSFTMNPVLTSIVMPALASSGATITATDDPALTVHLAASRARRRRAFVARDRLAAGCGHSPGFTCRDAGRSHGPADARQSVESRRAPCFQHS